MGKAPRVSPRFSKGELPPSHPAEGTGLGTLSPPTAFSAASEVGHFATAVIRSTTRVNPSQRGDGSRWPTRWKPPQLLSLQLGRLCYLPFPFQGRAPCRSNSPSFRVGSAALPARLSPERRLQHRGGSGVRAPRRQ